METTGKNACFYVCFFICSLWSGDILSRDISSQDIYCPGTICRRDDMSPYVPIILLFKGATYCPRRHIVPVRKGDILSRETYCPGWQQMVTLGNKCMKGYYGYYGYYYYLFLVC